MSLYQISFKEWPLRKNKTSLFSLFFILLICVVAIFAKHIAPFSFDEQNLNEILTFPSHSYLFGTDKLGRDLLSRIIYGSRMSMTVGIVTALLSLIIGTLYGALSGWLGGWTDFVMMRIVDVIYSIPSLVIMILVKVVVDGFELFENPELRALSSTLLALSLIGWVSLARLVRGQVLQVKNMIYIEAGRALGFSHLKLIKNHVLPNILGPIIVMLTFRIPSNILYESFLSFIGLGLQPPFSSWGVLVADGADMLEAYPHLIFFPGLILFLTMIAFQVLGDGLRDAYDPKAKIKMIVENQ